MDYVDLSLNLKCYILFNQSMQPLLYLNLNCKSFVGSGKTWKVEKEFESVIIMSKEIYSSGEESYTSRSIKWNEILEIVIFSYGQWYQRHMLLCSEGEVRSFFPLIQRFSFVHITWHSGCLIFKYSWLWYKWKLW